MYVCAVGEGGHDAAAVAAGSPACRGHLFTMESLPPGASDLGQGSLDRPLKRRREDTGFGEMHSPSLFFFPPPPPLLFQALSSKASLLAPLPNSSTHTLLTQSHHPTVAKLSPGTDRQASGRGTFLRCSTLMRAGHNRGRQQVRVDPLSSSGS